MAMICLKKSISFTQLKESHFPLMLLWLNKPHVKKWWPDDEWTMERIKQKYTSYVAGYKLENNIKKSINGFIINYCDIPIGYIQIYNAYDFKRAQDLIELPKKLAAFDIFIGEEDFINKGFGSFIIKKFLDDYCSKSFTHIFADPDRQNIAAIKAYEKAGFNIIEGSKLESEIWMLKEYAK